MENILTKIAERTKERVAEERNRTPLNELQRAVDFIVAHTPPSIFPFEQALRQPDISFICEIKKASPSKGIIAHDFPYLQIAKDYQAAGAAAISVLTEPFWFMGSDEYLRQIAEVVEIPLLRKDFTVDSSMIYEAKILGASAVLLICSILDKRELAEYVEISHEIGLSALVEVHDENEVEMALGAGARIIGVNNRDLKTFTVDLSLSERLRSLVPPDIIFVSESGISESADIQRLREINAHAALIGESIMRSPDKIAEINRLRGA